MRKDLSFLFQRELDALSREVALYPSDEDVWRPVPGQPNVGGTLALHLCGNLRHFIGAVLGGSGYVRNRELEFSLRGVSRHDLLAQVAGAKSEVMAALAQVGDEMLEQRYPLEYGGAIVRVDVSLLHLLSHLAFHLGQVDYHRRAATGSSTSANPISAETLVDAPSTRAPDVER
jgi:DinB superfamily